MLNGLFSQHLLNSSRNIFDLSFVARHMLNCVSLATSLCQKLSRFRKLLLVQLRLKEKILIRQEIVVGKLNKFESFGDN